MVWLDDERRLRKQQIYVDRFKAPHSAPSERHAGVPAASRPTPQVTYIFDYGTEVTASPPPTGQATDMTDQALQGGPPSRADHHRATPPVRSLHRTTARGPHRIEHEEARHPLHR